MAIKFSNSNLQGISYQTYEINKFNGADYTTIPSSVDDTRAIDISNYVPYGNALRKRYGWKLINGFKNGDAKLNIHDIWKINVPEKEDTYIVYASDISSLDGNFINSGLYIGNMSDNFSSLAPFYNLKVYNSVKPEEIYSQGFYFEGRLFLLVANSYLMIYYDKDNDIIECKQVKDDAFIPTIALGVSPIYSHPVDGNETKIDVNGSWTSFQEFNLLSNKINLEFINYKVSEFGNMTYIYDIASILPKTLIVNSIFVNSIELDNSESVFIENIGYLYYSNSTKKLSVIKPKQYLITEEEDPLFGKNIKYDDKEINTLYLVISFTNSSSSTIEKMQFGIPFGSYGYRDRLFLSGNPDIPNVDIHSGETNDLENPWKDYTYFPDTNYATFGTSDTKITGYGMLNNGSMAIFKEYSAGQPNLFFRNYNMMTDKDGNMIEYFPITISGLSLENNSIGQIMNYGNDLLVNNSRGIYKILAGESTATQTYYANEMSYFIRDNLGTDVSDSCHIVFEGKLYVSRRDKFGNKRIYVADENRYSFIDGKQIYEWWIFDGVNADKFWIFNDELYFFNEKGLCKFVKDSFVDEYHIDVPNANINGEDFSEYAFIDSIKNYVVLNENSEVFTEVKSLGKKTDMQQAYSVLKNNARIKFKGGFYAINKYDSSGISIEHWSSSDLYYIKVPLNARSDNKYIPHLLQYHREYNNGNFVYLGIKYNAVEIDYDESHYIITATKIGEDQSFVKDYMAVIYDGCEFEIYDILDSKKEKPLSECILEAEKWIWVGKDKQKYIELGRVDEVYFNKFQLKAAKYENTNYMLDFEFIPSNQLRDVSFEIVKPIESYWFSKYNSLGQIDLLKTADRITFLGDSRLGGKTEVGYRTSKSQTTFLSELKGWDFEYLDFNDTAFGFTDISQSHTTKKKIKNFTFMQLLFASNENKNSTIASIKFRYRFTKNNKGVR